MGQAPSRLTHLNRIDRPLHTRDPGWLIDRARSSWIATYRPPST
jgi:hypothetical protein